MPKAHSLFVCQQCGFQSSQNYGKCPECGTWGSMVETIEETRVAKAKGINKQKLLKDVVLVSLKDIEQQRYQRTSTKIGEFDRVLGGGIVQGSVVLIAGEPGIGKSTLLTQLAINVEKTLYVAGEESPQQIKIRAERIDPKSNLVVLNEVDVDVISATIESFKPNLVIIDSIQTMETQDLVSAPGSVGQVRESAHRLQRLAKALHIPIFLVGHVTKEGTVAGPRTLEHLVDVVLNLEGEPSSGFRMLRGIKNRFGPTDEVGIFEMEELGLKEVTNPSQIFLEQKVNAPGSVVVALINGTRVILVEIQALVTKTTLPVPRRVANGVDNNRLSLLCAVLQKRLGLALFDQDVFVNVTGGMKVSEPAADLGICLAIVSSYKDIPVSPKTVFAGEIGLLGELRVVRQLEKRISEAKKLGFDKVISAQMAKSLSQVILLEKLSR